MKKAAPKKDAARDVAKLIAQAAYDTKAGDLTVLDLRKLTVFTDYFIIASGSSDRQVQAISDRIEQQLKAQKIYALSVEGYQKGHWILLDYGSVVAHVFYEEARPFYSLEKLWGDAARVRFKLS